MVEYTVKINKSIMGVMARTGKKRTNCAMREPAQRGDQFCETVLSACWKLTFPKSHGVPVFPLSADAMSLRMDSREKEVLNAGLDGSSHARGRASSTEPVSREEVVDPRVRKSLVWQLKLRSEMRHLASCGGE
jgi:hypothetical protein